MSNYEERADKIFSRINELAAITEDPEMVTRTYGSDAFIEAEKKIQQWMLNAGLETRIDNIGNVRGRLNASAANSKTLIIASHIDSVVNAGKFDGPLGVLTGLDLIENLVTNKTQLPFNIELIAFCDEEGVRFHTTYLGSKVIAGAFDKSLFDKTDKDGITLKEVIQKPGGDPNKLNKDSLAKENLIGYFEIHIEQGPVLYEANIPVAVVTAIAGQKRVELIFTGVAGHAGTVPMNMRHDSLCCAAECIVSIENYAVNHKANIVATIGKLEIANAASNVIPGEIKCTLDIRSADEKHLSSAGIEIKNIINDICKKRNIHFEWNLIQETESVTCNKNFNDLLKQSIEISGYKVIELVSGAGHDAVPMSCICPVSMLFVRCYKGISHNPLEAVELKDIAATIKVADNFILNLASNYNQ